MGSSHSDTRTGVGADAGFTSTAAREPRSLGTIGIIEQVYFVVYSNWGLGGNFFLNHCRAKENCKKPDSLLAVL